MVVVAGAMRGAGLDVVCWPRGAWVEVDGNGALTDFATVVGRPAGRFGRLTVAHRRLPGVVCTCARREYLVACEHDGDDEGVVGFYPKEAAHVIRVVAYDQCDSPFTRDLRRAIRHAFDPRVWSGTDSEFRRHYETAIAALDHATLTRFALWARLLVTPWK